MSFIKPPWIEELALRQARLGPAPGELERAILNCETALANVIIVMKAQANDNPDPLARHFATVVPSARPSPA